MPAITIVSQKGPLPFTNIFKTPLDGPASLLVAGSVWTQQPNSMIGIQVVLDGTTIGTATIFANPAATHMSVVPIVIPINLSFGEHKLTLAPAGSSSTVSDGNDFYTVALIY